MANVESKSSLIMPGQSPAESRAEATPGCWSCGTMRAVHFCSACGKVQPPKPVDYFTFFGFTRKLNLDASVLETEFYALSRRLHPDVFGQADEQERAWSLEQSSMLNDAYRTLKDPVKRTEYLLRLEGIELEEQSKQATEKARATGELKKQVVPPDLLEEVFELNMHLEELRMQKKMGEDDPALLEEIGKAKLSLEEKHDALLNELKAEWKKWDESEDESIRRNALDKMLDVLNRRNYIRNLLRDVNEAMEG
ncbi:MAG TPA: Fe-S protein assembly co-chaperone HscB [Terriglobales bacterium]|jgi:molecular chaperone HscB|nr:Fe-S protein assembly co-chaperone HscB [Terriglobales bacterium]